MPARIPELGGCIRRRVFRAQDAHTPVAAPETKRLSEQRLDGFHQRKIIGCYPALEARHHVAVAVEQILVEVPLGIFTGLRDQGAIKRIGVILLGANMPLEELPLVMKRTQAQALLLSGAGAYPADALQRDLTELVSARSEPAYIGSAISARYHDAIVRAGALPIGEDIHQALRRIDETIGSGVKHAQSPTGNTQR